MPQYESLNVETDARGVVALTLNTPAKRNVLSATAIAELTDFAETTGSVGNSETIVF